jgi:hypothetical protein
MTEQINLNESIRTVFSQYPFTLLIAEGITSLHGNSNGTVFGSRQGGDNFSVSDASVDEGRALLEKILGQTSQARPILEVDIEVNGQGFCLSLIGPPATAGYTWSVVQRARVHEEGRAEITARVDLF